MVIVVVRKKLNLGFKKVCVPTINVPKWFINNESLWIKGFQKKIYVFTKYFISINSLFMFRYGTLMDCNKLESLLQSFFYAFLFF